VSESKWEDLRVCFPQSHFEKRFALACTACAKAPHHFGLAAGPHATCIIMAHGHDVCTLRNSPLPRLNRIKDTMWYYFFLFIVCCRVAAACCVFSALYPIALGELLFSCFSAYPHSVPALCVLCVVHCSAYLFKKERKKREGKEE
jgi:hypothetical protein